MFTENPEASGFTNGNLDWLYFDGRNPLETHPMMTSVPVWPNSVYAADLRNAIRTFFEIIFMTMVFSYNWEELKDFQLTKAAFRTMRPYFKSPWNWLDLISQFFCMLTMSGLYLVTIPIFDEAPAWPPTSPRDVWYGGGLNGGWYLNAICRSAGTRFEVYLILMNTVSFSLNLCIKLRIDVYDEKEGYSLFPHHLATSPRRHLATLPPLNDPITTSEPHANFSVR